MKKGFKITLFLIIIISCIIVITVPSVRIFIQPQITLFVNNFGYKTTPCINMKLFTSVGQNKSIFLVIKVPYKGERHKKEIYEKMPFVRNKLILSLSREGVIKMINNHEYRELKKGFVKVFNEYLKVPINDLYFDNITYRVDES